VSNLHHALEHMVDILLMTTFLQVVAFILIGVAVYGRASALVTNLPIIGGILACGVILFLISILGLIGAVKHHQVLLFFVSFFIHYLKPVDEIGICVSYLCYCDLILQVIF